MPFSRILKAGTIRLERWIGLGDESLEVSLEPGTSFRSGLSGIRLQVR